MARWLGEMIGASVGTDASARIDGAEAFDPEISNNDGAAPLLFICEHASNHIPDRFHGLGMSPSQLFNHATWDLGAYEVSGHLSGHFNAVLIAGRVSRLLYDCNRPPEAPDAIVEVSEIGDIPGNKGLSDAARRERVEQFYRPFEQAIARKIEASPRVRAIITIHSFTPVYWGKPRNVEIGILHDADSRLADAMLATANKFTSHAVVRNQPYGPQDGVTHTLKEHGIRNGLLNVMIEIRNDLIGTAEDQVKIGKMLAGWIDAALSQTMNSEPQRG
ncbi:MAG: N-formylglutamate amidohydrolase [Pseudomonadota bacterium]